VLTELLMRIPASAVSFITSPRLQVCLQKNPEHLAKIMQADDLDIAAAAEAADGVAPDGLPDGSSRQDSAAASQQQAQQQQGQQQHQ
jgi:hypothetical protein